MASHNVRVDFLFLDEGFGILDEESLDTALQTCQPGYDVPFHCHPCIEYLIIEGSAVFRIETEQGVETVSLTKGDTE